MDYELPPIDYLNVRLSDAIPRLQTQVAAGEAKLEFSEPNGYLRSLLKTLDIPISSQVLVFSKTSFQLTKISPRRPRALYFNDTVYVGTVQNGDVLEIAAMDADQGTIFYTLEQQPKDNPAFDRQTHNCLVCHGSSHTEGVPACLRLAPVYPDRSGHPVLSAGTFRTDYTSPLRERWGGWYVTGTHGDQRHMGNVVLKSGSEPEDLDIVVRRQRERPPLAIQPVGLRIAPQRHCGTDGAGASGGRAQSPDGRQLQRADHTTRRQDHE